VKKSRIAGTLLLLGLVVSSGACKKLQAKTPAAAPPPVLATPDPPGRLVIAVPLDPPTPPPVSTEKPAPPATGKPTGNRGAPPPTNPPTPPPPETNPPPVLQTGSSLAELETRAKERLERAQKDLDRVVRNNLGADARDQYDAAARFIRLARQAVTDKNFVYAHYCADKAATLASQLVK
jgi:hypothetical protein